MNSLDDDERRSCKSDQMTPDINETYKVMRDSHDSGRSRTFEVVTFVFRALILITKISLDSWAVIA
jgi:hypothetical protein